MQARIEKTIEETEEINKIRKEIVMNTFAEELANFMSWSPKGKSREKEKELILKIRELAEEDLNMAQSVFSCAVADLMRPKGLKKSPRCSWERLIGKIDREGLEEHLPVSDHDSLWLKDGKPYVYVMQPYSASDLQLEKLIQICKKNNLTFWIDAHSFYSPAGTISIKLYQKDDKHENMNMNLIVK
jgi:hypothetical protein